VKSIRGPSGEVSEADTPAQIVDPAKKAERLAKHAEKANSPEVRKAKKEARKTAAPKAAAKTKKPAAKKKSSGRKKAATTKKSAK